MLKKTHGETHSGRDKLGRTRTIAGLQPRTLKKTHGETHRGRETTKERPERLITWAWNMELKIEVDMLDRDATQINRRRMIEKIERRVGNRLRKAT